MTANWQCFWIGFGCAVVVVLSVQAWAREWGR